jgi:hypothetical protein
MPNDSDALAATELHIAPMALEAINPELGEHGDILAAQPRATAFPRAGQADFARIEAPASRHEQFPNLLFT